jgi:amidophosphoribosyltransferase
VLDEISSGDSISGISIADKEGSDSETEGWVVSSESCSFTSIGAKYYREVIPGKFISSNNRVP